MPRTSRLAIGLFGLLTGFTLIVGLAPGQGPNGDKGEKKDKGEKGKGKNKGEGEFIRKYAEKYAKGESPNLEKLEGEVEKMFRNLDRDGDGFLTTEELTEDLAAVAKRADRNGDGKISFDEYRTFLQRELQTTVASLPPPEPKREKEKRPEEPPPKTAEPKEDPRPTVYHDPKMYPKELPAWFKELDTDRDLQIGLYEWRAGKRRVEEFLEMDLNGDGFIEIEEYFRYLKRK